MTSVKRWGGKPTGTLSGAIQNAAREMSNERMPRSSGGIGGRKQATRISEPRKMKAKVTPIKKKR